MSGLQVCVREKVFPAAGDVGAHGALGDVRFFADHGEFVCLLGPSGCGKTTLLNIIAGLDPAYRGSLDLPTVSGRNAPVIGYVFQNPRLLPWRTVIENIELVLGPEQRASGLADELLALAGLEGFRDSHPARLSLGMSRRVSLVRAFAVQPDLLLMDEPFVSLDPSRAHQLRRLLIEIWGRRPTTVLFVTHDLREAICLSDRMLLLSAAPGRLIADVPNRLQRSDRWDPAALDAAQAALVEQHPAFVDMV